MAATFRQQLDGGRAMAKTSYVELCVSDFEQSIQWFEQVLGFRVIARDADEYAELARGETTIQLATDSAPYWASERPHLLPPGQRGSGVEIVLLVDNVEAVYRQAQQAGAEIARPIANYPWHMRQFWVRHPDGYLIRPAQRILSVKPATYRRQVADAFEDTTPIVQKLLPLKETADNLAEQHDYLGAATIYEALVQEIFEHSHLHINEEAAEYYEEEAYYPEEEGLDQFVEECITALGNCLADERDDKVAREKIIQALFDIYVQDLHASGQYDFASKAAEQLVRYTEPLERPTIAEWIHDILNDEEEEVDDYRRRAYGRFLLDLEKDTLDDETYLRICRETGRTSDLIDRLLVLGRVDEAVEEIHRANSYEFFRLVDLFMQHGQSAVAERMVKERNNEKPDTTALQWLQKYYRANGNLDAELEVTETLFRTVPGLAYYQELRTLARQLDRWETLRLELLAFLQQSGKAIILIEISLDEGDIEKALQLLKGTASKDTYGYTYGSGYGYYGYRDISLVVAAAAEEMNPREALELYRQYAERLIAMRGRQNYQQAIEYLKRVRTLYERLGEREAWTTYIATLREHNRNLRALKEELANAGL